MIIEGKKNLEFLKRTLHSHMIVCSQKSLSASDKESIEKWDPEIAEINVWLDATEKNLDQFKEEEPATRMVHAPQDMFQANDFFR